VLNAPTAAVVLHGGSDFYGTIMANTIDDSGGTNLHFDKADANLNTITPTISLDHTTGNFHVWGFHSVPY
jgi:hypothetical protein